MAELNQDVATAAKESQVELDKLGVHSRAASDAICRCMAAVSGAEAVRELEIIKRELGEIRIQVTMAKASLSRVHVAVGAARMTGQMERVTWVDERARMLESLRRVGDRTLEPDDSKDAGDVGGKA
jgi:hypothetical protein